MTTTLRFGLLLIAGVVGSLIPQTQASKSSKIENFIKSKEPAWQFSSPAREAEPESTFYQWQKGEEWIYFRVFVTDSKQAAAAKFKEFSRHMPVPWKEKLRGTGDEALLCQSANTNACMILFRRGNVFLQLNGSSADNA